MDIWEDAAWWVAFFLGCEVERKPDARGRGYRSGQGLRRGIQLRFRKVDGKPDARGSRHRSEQGLRRGILLGLREPAKTIASVPELAAGSNS